MRDRQRALLGPGRVGMRLGGYDYSLPGYYFITTCTHFRQNLFGHVEDGGMVMSPNGIAVDGAWNNLATLFTDLRLDEHIVMPNHVHGILVLGETLDGGSRAATTKATNGRSGRVASLSRIVNAFKTTAAIEVNEARGGLGEPVWQQRYYDHIVRDQSDLHRIREYIRNNPLKWSLDEENPESEAFKLRNRRRGS